MKSSPEWSADSSDRGKEFEPFVPIDAKADRFSLPPHYLQALWGDPAFQEQWREAIEHRVKEVLATEHERLRAETIEAATEEGRARGIEQGRLEVQQACNQLNLACEQVLAEKNELLRAHEKIWCQAMLHLMKRFLVPRSEEIMSVIQAWLDDNLKGFPQKAQVQIYLSEEDKARLERVLSFRLESAQARHQFGVDRNLGPGEIRCECEAGGIFFSPSQELNELGAYLDGMFSEAQPDEREEEAA